MPGKQVIHRAEFLVGVLAAAALVSLYLVAPSGTADPLPPTPTGPAAPATGTKYCQDTAIAQPTQAHAGPYESSPTVKSYNHDDTVKGNCFYYNNTDEAHWYMEVNYGSPPKHAYIWIQRLYYLDFRDLTRR